MQAFKKALSLTLTLTMLLTCAPALAGSASAAAEYEYYDVTGDNAITLHGVHYDSTNGVFARMDLNSTAAQNGYNNGIHTYAGTVYWHMRESAGGRARLATDSSTVAISATLYSWNSKQYATNMAAAKYGFDVYVDTVDGSVYAGTVKASDADIAAAAAKWTANDTSNDSKTTTVEEAIAKASELSVSGTVDLSKFATLDGKYNLTIYFPITMETKHVEIGVEAGKTVSAHAVPYTNTAPVVFYGSSITQGGVSTLPGNAYTAVASRLLNAEYHSFGMWGSCAGQTNVAQYIASLDMSVFVLDYDHNDTQATTFKGKHKTVYETVRAAHPDIPIIMISRPNRAMTYNATQDSIENMNAAILENYYAAVAAGDTNVHFIDGEAFFNYDGSLPSDTTYKYNKVYLSDGTHPTNAGQAAMAAVVANVISLANSGIKNIYVDKDEISFGGDKQDILFDSTDAIDAMTQNDWSAGTVVNKTLVLANGQNATLTVKNTDKWSGYTAVADLTVASGASATVTVGGKTITLSKLSENSCTVTVDGSSKVFGTELIKNANGSIRLVLGLTLVNDMFVVSVNGTEDYFKTGVMGGAPGFGADGGQVTVNSLQITAATQRAYYTAALGDKIGLNIHMSLTEAAAADAESYMVFTCGDNVSDPVMLPEPGADGTYAFSFDVAAKEMADEVIAAFYNSNGDMIAKHVTTVRDYATYIIENEGYSDKDKDIATALLNYGSCTLSITPITLPMAVLPTAGILNWISLRWMHMRLQLPAICLRA